MALVFVYTSDPGADVLVANGPAINIIEDLRRAIRFARGRGVLGMIGGVVNDRGAPAVPVKLDDLGVLEASYGGWSQYLGDGQASGYEGNLFAQTYGLDAPVLVLQAVDLAIKTATIATGTDLLVTLTRPTAAFGAFVYKAGGRIADNATPTYTIATLEDVSWGEAETGAKTVRARQVSGTPAALNTITVFLDAPDDTNVTVATTDVTVPDDVDAAELLLRYQHAIDHLLDNAVGRSVGVVFTDRQESGVCDHLSDAVVTASGQAYFQVACVSPPLGTTAALAQGAAGDGVGRATLDQTRTAYVHPAVSRAFVPDSDNLVSPNFLATFPAAAIAAARIANERPEQNPARPHRVLRQYGVVGVEALAIAPTLGDHYAAGIMQPTFDLDPDTGTTEATFHAGILADGSEIADRRLADWVHSNLLKRVRPYHKALATTTNQDAAVESCTLFLENAKASERIRDFGISASYDAGTEQFTIEVEINRTGNMNVITIRSVFGADVVTATAA